MSDSLFSGGQFDAYSFADAACFQVELSRLTRRLHHLYLVNANRSISAISQASLNSVAAGDPCAPLSTASVWTRSMLVPFAPAGANRTRTAD